MARTKAAKQVSRFPADLQSAALQPVGIEPDGWVKQDAQLVLSGGPATKLGIRGQALTLPRSQSQQLQLTINDKAIATEAVPAGPNLDLLISIPRSADDRHIRLHFAHTTAIAASDPRQAAIHLTFLGLTSARANTPPTVAGAPPLSLASFPADLGKAALQPVGIESDGWVKRDAQFVFAGGAATKLTIRGQALTLPNSQIQRLSVVINGKTVATVGVPPGPNLDLGIPIPASAGVRHIRFHFTHTTAIAANDPRQAAIHLTLLSVSPVISKTNFSATLSPAKESPQPSSVPLRAGGRFYGQLTDARLSWRLTLSHLSSSATAAYTHLDAGGGSGPQLFKLCGPCSTNESGTVSLTSAQASAFTAGRVYINVGTMTNPSGEVRGSVSP